TARDGGDDPAGHFANSAIADIGDVEVSRIVEGQSTREVEARRGGIAGIASEAGLTVAGERGDGAVGGDAAYAVIAGIRDIEVTIRTDLHGERSCERGLRGKDVIAVVLRGKLAVSGDGGDGAIGRDPANALVVRIGDVDVAEAIKSDTAGTGESCAGGK